MLSPDFIEGGAALFLGDCREVMKELPDNSIDAIVTDPPYELAFMAKQWDRTGIAYDVEMWAEALRVAKPGAHLLAFGGTRTHHRMICAIEDAGWEIRDCLGYLYGSGFPKSLNISKALDKAAGVEREVVDTIPDRWAGKGNVFQRATQAEAEKVNITIPATDAAKQWQGWGTALKPAWEPIVLARKPLIGTVAENVLRHGTGGINVDGCRVDTFKSGELDKLKSRANTPRQDFTGGRFHSGAEHTPKVIPSGMSNKGRFPANIIHDGSDDVLEIFPESKGQLADISLKAPSSKTSNVYGPMKREGEASQDRVYRDSGGTNYAMKPGARRGDSGSAARFFLLL